MSTTRHTPLADEYLDAAFDADELAEKCASDPTPENKSAKAAADAARDATYDAWLRSDEIREWEFGGESLGGGTEGGHWSTPSEVEEELRAWTEGGDWDLSNGAIWITDRAVALDPHTGDEIYNTKVSVTVAFQPDEPECMRGEDHDWQSPHDVVGGIEDNPGVWGSGGGIVSREVCSHCGRYRVTDTWATNPSTGEQGLTSVAYEDADDDSIAWVRDQRERGDHT